MMSKFVVWNSMSMGSSLPSMVTSPSRRGLPRRRFRHQRTVSDCAPRRRTTGGNVTWTEEFVVNLVSDATPPRVTRRFPGAGAIVGAASVVSASFSEPVQPATLTANTFSLVAAGTDQVFGTPDDSPVAGGALEYREDVATVVLNFQDPLPPGLYQARLTPPIADLAGNPLLGDVVWTFWILGEEDTDNDGVPDVVEAALGYESQQSGYQRQWHSRW